MLIHATLDYAPADRDRVHDRFLRTGATPPAGVEIIGRWHATAGNRGFLVAETEHPERIALWLQQWTDLIDCEVTPVLTDDAFANVIRASAEQGGVP